MDDFWEVSGNINSYALSANQMLEYVDTEDHFYLICLYFKKNQPNQQTKDKTQNTAQRAVMLGLMANQREPKKSVTLF